MSLVNSLSNPLYNLENYIPSNNLDQIRDIDPPHGPKKEIFNSHIYNDNATKKRSLEKTLKNRRKPHNTNIVTKKGSEFWLKWREKYDAFP
jgi:hypothetical protein